MLTVYDYGMIAFYFLFMGSLGFIFKKFNSGSQDYFAGGFKMTWWLLGASVFVGNFSAWTFTGAAYVAYSFGVVVLVIFWGNAANYVIQALWLAPWFRQIRVVTAMEAIRKRFGVAIEQSYTWLQILLSIVGNAVTLLSVSLVVSTIFGVSVVPTIIVTGVVVVSISLFGGSWAVAASDFIQSILILAVAIVASIMCIQQLGGIESFWDQIPMERKEFLLEGDIKYDKWWVLAMLISTIYMNNNLGMTAKYLAAKDSINASKAAWVAAIGFLFVTPIFFVPAMATFTLVPDLAERYSHHSNPAELSYIASCIAVLPKGMLGLLAAALFSATMSSMDTYLNKVSGFFTENFYKTIIKKNQASSEHLMRVGQLVTLIIGIMAVINAIILSQTDIALFDVFQMTNSYLIIPMGVPVFLGLFIHKTRRWVPFVTIFVGVVITFVLYDDFNMAWIASLKELTLSADAIAYIASHKFAVANLVNIPLLTVGYLLLSWMLPENDPKILNEEDQFFETMHTPIDFEKEVGGDNSHLQAKILGRLLLVYGAFMLLGALIPNSTTGRLAFIAVGLLMGGIGAILEVVYRRKIKIMGEEHV